jgi:glycosyltransferase involved in cell wall biosynthesis
MTTPLVSVITNNYNCASYLRANIESVLRQDYENWQHIVVDDGSTDGSMEILREMQHPRLKVMSVPHCGVSESRNLAIAQAEGEFIAILDADDAALPWRLRTQMQYFVDAPSTVLVAGGIIRVDQATNQERTFLFPSTHDSIVTLLRAMFNCLPHSTMIYRHQAFHSVGGYLIEKSEDFDLAVRLSRIGRLASVQKAVTRYAYRRVGSRTETYGPKDRGFLFYAAMSVISDAAKNANIEVSRSALEAWLDDVGDNGFAALQGRWAARSLLEALQGRDMTLLRYLGQVAALHLGPMAKHWFDRWWRDASTPLAIARRLSVLSSRTSDTHG